MRDIQYINGFSLIVPNLPLDLAVLVLYFLGQLASLGRQTLSLFEYSRLESIRLCHFSSEFFAIHYPQRFLE